MQENGVDLFGVAIVFAHVFANSSKRVRRVVCWRLVTKGRQLLQQSREFHRIEAEFACECSVDVKQRGRQ